MVKFRIFQNSMQQRFTLPLICLLVTTIFLATIPVDAQSTEISEDGKVGTLKENDLSFGLRLNTNGWGLFGTYGTAHSADRSRFFQGEFVEIKHPKEIKYSNDYGTTTQGYSPKPFVFGKQNSFFAVRFAYGNRVFLGGKAEKSGVEVNWVYQVGPSLGILKPYYLDVLYEVERQNNITIYEPRPTKYDANDPDSRFMQRELIFGASGFSHGLDEIKLVPGINAKTGFNFDWANYSDYVLAVEVGLSVDVYTQSIPIMVVENNRPYFVALYLGIQFGKRW